MKSSFRVYRTNRGPDRFDSSIRFSVSMLTYSLVVAR